MGEIEAKFNPIDDPIDHKILVNITGFDQVNNNDDEKNATLDAGRDPNTNRNLIADYNAVVKINQDEEVTSFHEEPP